MEVAITPATTTLATLARPLQATTTTTPGRPMEATITPARKMKTTTLARLLQATTTTTTLARPLTAKAAASKAASAKTLRANGFCCMDQPTALAQV